MIPVWSAMIRTKMSGVRSPSLPGPAGLAHLRAPLVDSCRTVPPPSLHLRRLDRPPPGHPAPNTDPRRPRTSGGRVRFAYRARTNRSSGRAVSAFDVRAKLRFHRATTPRRLRGRDLRVTAELNPLAERRGGDRS